MEMKKNRKKAHEIGWENTKNYDPNLSKECWAEMAAIDMGGWKDKCFDEVIASIRETYGNDWSVMSICNLIEHRYYDKCGGKEDSPNESKAREIAKRAFEKPVTRGVYTEYDFYCAAMEMAEWKDSHID